VIILYIDQSIAMLSITAPVLGRMDTVHPTLLWDDEDVVLIDTGFPRQLEQIHAQVESCGVVMDRLNRVIITHQDIDHIGNIQSLVEGSSSLIEVSTHAIEKPYVQGDKRILRFTDEAIASVDRMPEHVPESFKKGLKALMLNPPKARVDRVFVDGEILPWCGGIVVIETPGHTPGHVSLFHKPSRTLIAGDALIIQDGQLCSADPVTTLDLPMAHASIQKLAAFDIQSIICYHGGIFRENVNKRLAELAAEVA
jgi:glyoxylase-like metal-dependent hydrolase (beta-lactamase superfamily II)